MYGLTAIRTHNIPVLMNNPVNYTYLYLTTIGDYKQVCTEGVCSYNYDLVLFTNPPVLTQREMKTFSMFFLTGTCLILRGIGYEQVKGNRYLVYNGQTIYTQI